MARAGIVGGWRTDHEDRLSKPLMWNLMREWLTPLKLQDSFVALTVMHMPSLFSAPSLEASHLQLFSSSVFISSLKKKSLIIFFCVVPKSLKLRLESLHPPSSITSSSSPPKF